MLLINIDSSKANRHEIVELGGIFRARIASVSPTSITFEMTGTKKSIDDFMMMVKPYGIKEVVRSGTIAIAQAKK